MQDLSWDAVFASQGRATENGYVTEFAIPFRSLRYPKGEVQNWQIFVSRFTPNPWTM